MTLPNHDWIRVEDRLPEDGADIWIFRAYVPRGAPFVDRLADVKTNDFDGWFRHWGITHWQPCEKPNPPEKDFV